MSWSQQKNSHRQKGISIIEYLIALTILSLVVVGAFGLASTGVKNNHFVIEVGDLDILGERKANELIKQLPVILTQMPKQTSSVGSLTELLPLYSEQLNDSGCVIRTNSDEGAIGVDCTAIADQAVGQTLSASRVPTFTRQWLILTNYPDQGNVTVVVKLVRLGINPITRIARQTKVDGIIQSPLKPSAGGLGGK